MESDKLIQNLAESSQVDQFYDLLNRFLKPLFENLILAVFNSFPKQGIMWLSFSRQYFFSKQGINWVLLYTLLKTKINYHYSTMTAPSHLFIFYCQVKEEIGIKSRDIFGGDGQSFYQKSNGTS